MLRGNYAAKIDDKGRLKIPNAFRALVEGQHGAEVFVTSLTGEYVRIYPMPVWMALEEKLGRMPSTHPARIKFFDRANYYGQTAAIDTQGRVLLHGRLREAAGMSGEVDVFGQVRIPRRLEPRALRRQAPARALHGRRRARAVGIRHLTSMTDARHVPVMTREVVALLRPERGGLFLDCTVGLGGHTRALLEAGASRVLGLDRDAEALALAREAMQAWGDRVELVHADYRDLPKVLDDRGIAGVDGALADLGVSSLQLDAADRGFSFRRDEPLDMRMDRSQGRSAAQLLHDVDERALADSDLRYGEERFSRRIARAIVAAREAVQPRAAGQAEAGRARRRRLLDGIPG